MFQFTISTTAFEWNGLHTVNVWDMGMASWDEWEEIDVFSLDYSHDNHTRLDAMAAALEWLETANV